MTPENTPVTAAIIGLGRIASTLEDDPLREKPSSHAGALTQNKDIRLIAGCDLLEEKRTAFSKRWNVDQVFEDPLEMIRQCRPEVVHIATPPETHLPLIKLIVQEKLKLIVCEKPLAHTKADSKKIVALCQKHQVRLMTNHERRFALDYQSVKKLIESKTYGELISLHAFLYMGKTRPAGDQLLDDGTHMVDIIRFLTSRELTDFSVHGDAVEIGKTLDAQFVLKAEEKSDVRGSLEVGGGRDHLVFELELSFETGKIRVGNGIYELWESKPSPHYARIRSLQKLKEGFGPTAYFSEMVKEAVALVKDESRQPLSSGLDGLRAVETIEKMVKLSKKSWWQK